MTARGRLIGYRVAGGGPGGSDLICHPSTVTLVYEECPPGTPVELLDEAIMAAYEVVDDSDILALSGIVDLAVPHRRAHPGQGQAMTRCPACGWPTGNRGVGRTKTSSPTASPTATTRAA